MKWLRSLLRLRKRSDKVKIALALFLLAGFLGWDVCAGAADYISMLGEPVEYAAAPAVRGAALEGLMQTAAQREDVVCVSKQRVFTLTGSRQVEVTEVSSEYLRAGLGLEQAVSQADFFLGSEAFAALCGSTAKSPVRMVFRDGEGSVSGLFMLVRELPGGAAFAKGTTRTLGDAETLRVMMDGPDIGGTDKAWLESMGLVVEHGEELLQVEYEAGLLLTKLRYGGLACLLGLALGWRLMAEGRREAGP